MVEPIGRAQRQLVNVMTSGFVARGAELFDCTLQPIPVLFDLSGHTAGMFKETAQGCVIRYNPWIFGKYFQENLRDTVPHEVAHYVVHTLHPSGRVKPHGRQWLAVMEAFGADPGVTFDLDLEGIPQRQQRTHVYHCQCRLHEVSTTRHNRVQRGTGRYQCRYCNTELVFAP
ncbi:MAG: SprT protein [Bacteroidia bacterium]